MNILYKIRTIAFCLYTIYWNFKKPVIIYFGIYYYIYFGLLLMPLSIFLAFFFNFFYPYNKFFSNNELKHAIQEYIVNKDKIMSLYGNINNWDVSNITNMDNLFRNMIDFNEDISNWNVSNVKSMISMFEGCNSFNCNIEKWNIENVENTSYMFFNACSFNQNLNNWNIKNINNMNYMFEGALNFKKENIEKWNIRNIKILGLEKIYTKPIICKYKDLSDKDKINNSECPILMVEYNDNMLICKLSCEHIFSNDAFLLWIQKKKICPLCRKKLYTR